jgi:chromosome segregation ATPase
LIQYAPEIGFAPVALTTVLAAWILFRRHQRSQRDEGYIEHLDFGRALDQLRAEFQHSIEATLSRAARIGEKVLAAVKPIEEALRDFSSRIAKLETRADASDELSASLQSSLRAQESSSKEVARTVEEMNLRFEVFHKQLTTMSDQLSSLRQTIDGLAAQNDQHGEKLGTIKSGLAAIQGQMDGLLQRVNVGQTDLTELSTKTEAMVESVVRLESCSRQTEQRLTDVERRFASKPAEPKETLTDASIATESEKDTSENRTARVDSQASSGDGKLDRDEGPVDA